MLKRLSIMAVLLVWLPTSLMCQTCVQSRVSCMNDSCSEERLSSRDGLTLVRRRNEVVLQTADGTRKPIFRDSRTDCSVAAALIEGSHIYVEPCSGKAFVADTNGKELYQMPSFKFWDIASDKTGTLFAVFERGRSSMHEFEKSSYDKLRLLVFKTDTGEKLFERKWSAALGEHPSSESVALSDDGSILFLCRPNGAALSFRLESSQAIQ